jgi:hypothetical protein
MAGCLFATIPDGPSDHKKGFDVQWCTASQQINESEIDLASKCESLGSFFRLTHTSKVGAAFTHRRIARFIAERTDPGLAAGTRFADFFMDKSS